MVTEKAVKDTVMELIMKWILTQSDIDRIKDKFELEFTDNCQMIAGKYEVQYEIWNQWIRKNTKTLQIDLMVSSCHKIGFLLQKYALDRLITIHELWHHVWWYKDPDTSRFTDICWLTTWKTNGECVSYDFVSEYAQKSPEEDYAEHFQQRFIKKRQTQWLMTDKIAYFARLFPQ
jgi:hypothetical protein